MVLASRYVLRRRLGRGGMGEVHEAVAKGASGFERRVAIKRLIPEHAADELQQRMFLDEARIASRLNHGGIVAIIDYGVIDGAPFQVLELVDGVSSAAAAAIGREAGSPMPVEVALHIVTEAAHALHFAHQACDDQGRPLGIVHRDVKPANILLSRHGDVKVGDFGIAMALDRLAQTTGVVSKGTPGYMAPEQLFGGHVDGRADVFALGCTLHALAAGRSPIAEREAHTRMLVGEEPTLSSDLPEDVSEIVRRAIRREPKDRYPSAADMARALGEALAPRLNTDGKSALMAWLRPRLEAQKAAEAPSTATATATTTPPVEVVLQSDRGGTRVFSSRGPAPRQTASAPRAQRRTRRVFALSVSATLVVAGAIAVGASGYTSSRNAVPDAKASSDALTSPVVPSFLEPPLDAAPDGAPDLNDDAAVTPATPDRRRNATPSSQPGGVRVVANGNCNCADDETHEDLCPTERRLATALSCTCETTTPRSPLCAIPRGWSSTAQSPQTCDFNSFVSPSGKGGEDCVGLTTGGAGREERRGKVRCQLCSFYRVYIGKQDAPCKGLSGVGAGERTGKLVCWG